MTTLVLRHRDSPYHDSIYRISHAIHHCRNKSVLIHFNPLNAELNPICHLLALLGGATIAVVSRLRVNVVTIHTQLYLSLPTVIYEFWARYLVFASAVIDHSPQTNSGIPGSLTLSNFELKF